MWPTLLSVWLRTWTTRRGAPLDTLDTLDIQLFAASALQLSTRERGWRVLGGKTIDGRKEARAYARSVNPAHRPPAHRAHHPSAATSDDSAAGAAADEQREGDRRSGRQRSEPCVLCSNSITVGARWRDTLMLRPAGRTTLAAATLSVARDMPFGRRRRADGRAARVGRGGSVHSMQETYSYGCRVC